MKIVIQLLLSYLMVDLNRANEGSFDHRILYSIGAVSLSLVNPGVAVMYTAPTTQQYRYVPKVVKVDNETETGGYKYNLTKFYLECLSETHLNPNLLVRFIARYWDDNRDLKEWALCVLCKLELMTPQGVYRYDTALTKISIQDKRPFDLIIDECLTEKSLPPREIAWRYLKCVEYFRKKKPKVAIARLGIFFN